MNSGRMVFAQLLGFVPFAHFEHLVDKYQANRWTRDFTTWSHFICMAYAQLTRREGLRDLIACLNSQKSKLYHVGLLLLLSSAIMVNYLYELDAIEDNHEKFIKKEVVYSKGLSRLY